MNNYTAIFQALEEVNKFLSEEHTFEEYVDYILEYKTTSLEIPVKMEHVITMGMYVMYRPDLIDTLIFASDSLGEMLTNRVNNDCQAICKT